MALVGAPANAIELPGEIAGSLDTIETKYCGSFIAATFKCNDTAQRSWIGTVCYDSESDLALLNRRGVNYCYCGIGAARVQEFLSSPSLSRYYNAEIKGRFHCRGLDSRPLD